MPSLSFMAVLTFPIQVLYEERNLNSWILNLLGKLLSEEKLFPAYPQNQEKWAETEY